MVSALMPFTMQSAQKKVKVDADKSTEVNLEIVFDAKKMMPAKPPKPKIEIH